jgi:hypothetical protein
VKRKSLRCRPSTKAANLALKSGARTQCKGPHRVSSHRATRFWVLRVASFLHTRSSFEMILFRSEASSTQPGFLGEKLTIIAIADPPCRPSPSPNHSEDRHFDKEFRSDDSSAAVPSSPSLSERSGTAQKCSNHGGRDETGRTTRFSFGHRHVPPCNWPTSFHSGTSYEVTFV